MLPVSDLDVVLLYTDGFWKSLLGERVGLILRTIFNAFVFLFPWNKPDLNLPNTNYIPTRKTTIIGLDSTILKFKKKILTLFLYGQSCVL